MAGMLGAAVVAGVLLLQWGRAPGRSAESDAAHGVLRTLPLDLAVLNGYAIHRHEVAHELAGTPDLTMDDVRGAVQRVIDETLLADGAAIMGQRPGSGATWEDILARQAVVWPEEIEAFWNRHKQTLEGDFVRVRRAARQSEQEARDVRKTFLTTAVVAPENTAVQSVEWLGSGQLDAALERVLSGMTPGEISEPVLTAGEYHVIHLLDRKPASQTTLADWRPRLAGYLRAERWHRERMRWLRVREAYAALEVAPELTSHKSALGLEQFRRRPDLVAIVNGKAITEEQLATQVRQTRSMTRKSLLPPMAERELRVALSRMIQGALVREEAQKLGLEVPDSELEQRFQVLRTGFPSDEAFDAMLHANATSRDDWWRNMREGLLLLKTESAQMGRLPVEPSQIEAYWKENQAALVRDRLKILRVQFHTEQEAHQALAQIRSGGSVESFPKASHIGYQQADDAAQWFTHDMLPHQAWVAAWPATLQTVVGPVPSPDGYWLLRVDDRQEAKTQTLSDHREHVIGILQRTHWVQRERARWMLSKLEGATVWNRFDLTLKLNQKAPPTPGLQIGKHPTLIVITLEQGCHVGVCDAIEREWNRPVSLQIVSRLDAEQAVRLWGLPTVPWTFAIDEHGIVVGEYPGPVTKTALERLSSLLEPEPPPVQSAFLPDRSESVHAH